MALELMVWFNAVSLILWPSSFTLPNILRAAGDAAFTMTVSVVSMWVFRVAFCYLMVLKFHCGLLFIWMGMFLDWAMRSLFFFVRFVRGRWMEQKGDLSFRISGPLRHCSFGGEGLFCAGNPHPVSYQ